MKLSKATWPFVFLIIFFLSQDFWRWNDEIDIGLLGFPTWLFHFAWLQVALAVALGWFALTRWGDDDE